MESCRNLSSCNDEFFCSECGLEFELFNDYGGYYIMTLKDGRTLYLPKYCPNCGREIDTNQEWETCYEYY